MLGAADLATVRGRLSEHDRQALAALIKKLGRLPALGDLGIESAIEAIRRDKKVLHGRLHYVIATGIGTTETIDDVTEDELRGVMARLGMAA
jgi:3-dehydroquinate synthase